MLKFCLVLIGNRVVKSMMYRSVFKWCLVVSLLSGCGGGGSSSDGSPAAMDISFDNVNVVFFESFGQLESGLDIADALMSITLSAVPSLTPGGTTPFACDDGSGSNFVEYQSATATVEAGDTIIDTYTSCDLAGVILDGVITFSFEANTDALTDFFEGTVTFENFTVLIDSTSVGVRGSLSFAINESDDSFRYRNSQTVSDDNFEVGAGPIANEFSDSIIYDIVNAQRFSATRSLDLDVSYDSPILNQTVAIETTPQLQANPGEWPSFGGVTISAGDSFVELNAIENFINNTGLPIFSISVNGMTPSAPNPNPDPLAPSLLFNDVRWDEISIGFFVPFGS